MSDTHLPLVTPQDLAATYNTPNYDEPWTAVEDYHDVLDYTAAHPDAGSTAVATALNLPRSRIRPWMNGSRPDAVHGIQTAHDHHWLADNRETQRALLELAAWVLAGGNLTTAPNYAVTFTLDDDTQHDHFAEIATHANLDYDVIRTDDDSHATEARPTTGGSVLARLLSCLGIPGGDKTTTLTRLPAVLNEVDDAFRRAFAQRYIQIRASDHAAKDTLTIQEARDPAYLESLASFFESVSGESVTVSENQITISAAAARALRDD